MLWQAHSVSRHFTEPHMVTQKPDKPDKPVRLDLDNLPDAAFVRAAPLINSGVLPFSKATLWRLVKAGRFPKPAKLSDNITAWNVGAVRHWQASMLATQVAIADEGDCNDL